MHVSRAQRDLTVDNIETVLIRNSPVSPGIKERIASLTNNNKIIKFIIISVRNLAENSSLN